MEPWERYTYRVSWSEEDGEFVALCAELPGLSWLDESADAALAGIRRAAGEALEILSEDGEAAPVPLSDRRYSGVFKVRVPPEVHRRLVLEATEQNVSLNRLATAKLASHWPVPGPGPESPPSVAGNRRRGRSRARPTGPDA